MKVLVTYATKYGSTAEIAEGIRKGISSRGIPADVVEVSLVKNLEKYDAVVVGSAVYIGSWRKPAIKFLKKNKKQLKKKSVWIFSSGPTGTGAIEELLDGWKLPKKLIPLADRIGAREIKVFHGAASRENLPGIQRKMFDKSDAEYGDFRDWDEIHSWARAIADELTE